jgi:hypothetical protein
MTSQFRWVERSPQFTPFGPDFVSSEEAVAWAKEWKSTGGLMTPEHAEIFLIFKNQGTWDIHRKYEGASPTTLGMLLW